MALIVGTAGPSIGEEVRPTDGAPSSSSPTSLMEAAPELLAILRCKPDYFGSPWHRGGGWLERGSLTGDWGGSRQSLVDKGIYADVGLTQVLHAGLQGGLSDRRGPRYRGSSDYYLTLDTAKLGLWPGGLVNMNGESVFGDAVGDKVESIMPPNADGVFPDPAGGGANSTLSELYMVQALSTKLVAVLGKVNALGLGDRNAYTNNERTQFMNLAFLCNPILGAFIPYTPLAAAVVFAPIPQLQVTTGALDSEGKAGTAGFDPLFTKGTTVTQEWDATFHPLEQKGTYRLGFAYTDKQVKTFNVDRRLAIGRVLELIPRNDRDDNWVVYGNFDQAFWTVDAEADRSMGIFFRFAVAPRIAMSSTASTASVSAVAG